MRVPVAFCLLLLALAGCSEAPPEATEPLEATATTGVLRGVVVDAAVAPLPEATVTLVGGNRSATTDADGLFGFDGLEPGVHTVRVERDGYVATETQGTVVAGVEDPERLRVELARDPERTPFVESSTWNGFIQCSARVETVALGPAGLAVCSAGEPTVDVDDDVFRRLEFGGAPHFVQTDLQWDSTQPLGDEMSIRYGPEDCGNTNWREAEGTSPLSLTMPGVLLADKDVDASTGICARVFVWVSETAGDLAGAGVQQDFEAFTHAFYNFEPADGWNFPRDGPPPVPDA